MTDVTVKRLDELEPFYHGTFRRLRAALGVQAFGIQVITLPPHCDVYPEHDHTDNGQEEVYVTLAGRATLTVAGERYTLEPDVFVRVGPSEPRKVVTGDEGVQLVVVGGTPGRSYTPPPYTDKGAALAVARADPTEVEVGRTVSFDASDSTAGLDQGPLSFAWDFEGTGSFVGTGPAATHTYERPGGYTAVLRVTDTAGRSDSDKVRIEVTGPA